MADIQTQLPIKITDGTNTAAISVSSALKTDSSAVTQPVSGTVTLSSQTVTIGSTTVTQPVSGTVTNVPSGTQTVTGTVTLSSQTVTTNADTNLAAGTAPSKALVGAMQYNSSQPTLTNGQTVALQSDVNGNLKIAGTLTTSPSGTQAVSGTVTNVPSGTQTVTGTVTNVPSGTQTVTGTVTTNADTNLAAGTAPSKALVGAMQYNSSQPTLTNGQTVALQSDVNGNLKIAGTLTTSPSGTQAVSGTVTNVPSGTQAVSGTVTNVPSGTQAVSGTVTIGASSNTQAVSGSVTVVPETTQIVTSYGVSTTVASSSTGTISYTVTTAKTLYWKGFMAASSGGPCKVTVDYGAGPTTVAVAFYSTSSPFLNVTFPQPIIVAATTVCNIKIQNNAGAAQDVYGTFFGSEH